MNVSGDVFSSDSITDTYENSIVAFSKILHSAEAANNVRSVTVRIIFVGLCKSGITCFPIG